MVRFTLIIPYDRITELLKNIYKRIFLILIILTKKIILKSYLLSYLLT